jgi:hypothetical protein
MLLTKAMSIESSRCGEHKTVSSHGSARIAMHIRIYQLLVEYLGERPHLHQCHRRETNGHLTVELVRTFREEVLNHTNNEQETNDSCAHTLETILLFRTREVPEDHYICAAPC